MDIGFPSFLSQSENETQNTTEIAPGLCYNEKKPPRPLFSIENTPSVSSTQKRKTFRLTLKPEDFMEDSPPRKHKIPRNLFPNGQISNCINKSKHSMEFPVNNNGNNVTKQSTISTENNSMVSNKSLRLKFSLKPEDFLDTPPKGNKRKTNCTKATSHKENNPPTFIKPMKPAAKAHNTGFSFRKKPVSKTKKPNCSGTINGSTRSLQSNPDESQPLLNVDEVGEVLIKKQSVFKERRRFFPSIGSIPKTPRQNPHVLTKPSRRISILKQKVISPIQETAVVPQPDEKPQQNNTIDDKTPPQNFTTESPQISLLKKALKKSIRKNDNKNCCTPANSNLDSGSQISSIQSFLRMRVASSRKRLLNLSSQRIVYSSPDCDFLNEEKNCDSTKKPSENLKTTKEKCDKETQTDDSYPDVFKDTLVAFTMLKDSLQKLGMKID